MFEPIIQLAKRMQKVDGKKIFRKIIAEKPVQQQIIDANQYQLEVQGVDSEGDATGEYSDATIYGTVNFEGKIAKRQEYDHITLKDSGASYRSMKVVRDGDGFIVKAKFPPMVLKRWRYALGLTKESEEKVNEETIKPRMQEEIKKKLMP